MEFVAEAHRFLSQAIVLYFLLAGLWGLLRAVRKQGLDGDYLGALVIAEGLYIVEALLGAALMIAGERPGRGVHLLYGVFALVALPGLFAYLRGDDSNQAQWYFALLTLFLAGVGIRAIGTAD
ncbi:MAG: hypothetical protein ACRDHL_05155 [Candidatus Promineifilaceae bacterium]